MSTAVIVIIVVAALVVLGLLVWIGRSARGRAAGGREAQEALRDDLGHRSHAERARSHR